MSYNDYLVYGFNAYRKWFNKMFKLSYDGKFCGLLRLGDKLDVFINRLSRLLHRSRISKPLGDIIQFRIRGHIVKLYNA